METNLIPPERAETQDTVIDIDKLTGAELDEYLAELKAKEQASTTDAETQKAEEVTPGAETAQATTDETGKEAQPTVEELLADRDKWKKVAEDKELFNQRQANELGLTRKTLLEAQRKSIPELSAEEIQSRAMDDPQKLARDQEDRGRQIADFERQQQDIYKEQNRVTITQFYPQFEELLPSIEAIAKEDGVASENIRAFIADPYSEDVVNVMHYAKRAEAAKKIVDLQTKLEAEQKKKTEVVDKIQEAAKAKAHLTNKAGTTTADAPEQLSEEQVLSLSGDDLKKEIAKRQKEESGG